MSHVVILEPHLSQDEISSPAYLLVIFSNLTAHSQPTRDSPICVPRNYLV